MQSIDKQVAVVAVHLFIEHLSACGSLGGQHPRGGPLHMLNAGLLKLIPSSYGKLKLIRQRSPAK